jgi:hypothetical protein
MDTAVPPAAPAERRWKPLPAACRRVAGVLVEKAKTTPDAYPMTLNALVAGCNQKSNRHPLTQLEPEDVEQALEQLRGLGAASLVQGSGRVDKYRHQMYEWLAVDKVEMAVMVELLLRGPQTEGELRGHASRMEPIEDLAALRQVLERLKARGLVLPLNAQGRGHVVCHALYQPGELEKLKNEFGRTAAAEPCSAGPALPAAPAAPLAGSGPELAELACQVDELRSQLAELRDEVRRLAADCRGRLDEFERFKEAVGG